MSDLKISCPNCGGHVTYPKEIAGQAASCPHCQQPIVLGVKSRATFWVIVSAAIACAVLGTAALFWHLGKRTAASAPLNRPPRETTKVFDKERTAPAANARLESEDDKAIEALCRAFYDKSNEKDFETMRLMLAARCRPVVTTTTLEKSFKGSATYRFIALDSITYSDSPAGKLAKARIRRTVLTSTSDAEGVREFKCIKESDGWKLFRDFEWMQELVSDFERSGFTDKLGADVRVYCASNPFEKWPADQTNAFEKIYETVYGPNEIFPWNLALTLETNYVEGWMLKIGFTVRNNAPRLWENGGLNFELKQGGNVVLTGFVLLPNVPAGTDIHNEASFFLKNGVLENTHYDLDVLYTLNRQKCRVASNLPVDFKVQKLSEAVTLEITGRTFANTKNTAFEDVLVARVDYRIRNTGKEPLKTVALKFAWFSLNGDLLIQTSEYPVSYGDLPLPPQQAKSGFADCGVGYSYRRVPVKVDIYLEDGEKHWPLYKGLLVQ